jgi:hypothetical protein
MWVRRRSPKKSSKLCLSEGTGAVRRIKDYKRREGLRVGVYAIWVVVQFENLQRIVIPKRGIMREESAVSPLAGSRFLADKAGFGMTRRGGFYANCTIT